MPPRARGQTRRSDHPVPSSRVPGAADLGLGLDTLRSSLGKLTLGLWPPRPSGGPGSPVGPELTPQAAGRGSLAAPGRGADGAAGRQGWAHALAVRQGFRRVPGLRRGVLAPLQPGETHGGFMQACQQPGMRLAGPGPVLGLLGCTPSGTRPGAPQGPLLGISARAEASLATLAQRGLRAHGASSWPLCGLFTALGLEAVGWWVSAGFQTEAKRRQVRNSGTKCLAESCYHPGLDLQGRLQDVLRISPGPSSPGPHGTGPPWSTRAGGSAR